MIKELCVLCAQTECLFDCRSRLVYFASFEGSPRKGICPVDVTPHRIFLQSICIPGFRFDVVIRVEKGLLAIVESAVDFVQVCDLLDERILSGSLFFATGELIQIAQSGYKSRIRNNTRCALVI